MKNLPPQAARQGLEWGLALAHAKHLAQTNESAHPVVCAELYAQPVGWTFTARYNMDDVDAGEAPICSIL